MIDSHGRYTDATPRLRSAVICMVLGAVGVGAIAAGYYLAMLLHRGGSGARLLAAGVGVTLVVVATARLAATKLVKWLHEGGA